MAYMPDDVYVVEKDGRTQLYVYCNHQCMPQLQPSCSAALVPMSDVLPEGMGMEARALCIG